MIVVTRPQTAEDKALAPALVRLLATSGVPKYVRDPASAWLAKQT